MLAKNSSGTHGRWFYFYASDLIHAINRFDEGEGKTLKMKFSFEDRINKANEHIVYDDYSGELESQGSTQNHTLQR